MRSSSNTKLTSREHTHTLSLALSHSLSHTHTLSLSLSRTHIHRYVLVYSIADMRSFRTLQAINTKLVNLVGTSVPRVLVGNKCDLLMRCVCVYVCVCVLCVCFCLCYCVCLFFLCMCVCTCESEFVESETESESVFVSVSVSQREWVWRSTCCSVEAITSDTTKMCVFGCVCVCMCREVSREQGQALADEWGCGFVECSAKMNINIGNFRTHTHTHPLSLTHTHSHAHKKNKHTRTHTEWPRCISQWIRSGISRVTSVLNIIIHNEK